MLKFEKHKDLLSLDLNSRFVLFCRIKKFLHENTLNFLYKSSVTLEYSKLEYAIIAYDFTYNTHLDVLGRIQKRFSRFITNETFRAHTQTLFERLNWKTIDNTVKTQSTIYIHKSINGFGSEITKKLFEINSNRISSRRGRDQLHINVPTPKNNFFKNSLFYRGIEIWNSIPLSLRSDKCQTCFKFGLKFFDFNSIQF